MNPRVLITSFVKMVIAGLCALLIPLCGFGNEAVHAPAYFIHTKNRLPPPWHTGEIIAQADYRGERDTARLHSLRIVTGKNVIRVPQRIRKFFPAPNLGTFELLCVPEVERGSKDHPYVMLVFRFLSLPEYGIDASPTTLPIARIVVVDGRILRLEKVEEVSEKMTTYTNYDPKTLKETGKVAITRVQ